jgi:hypothetical protein
MTPDERRANEAALRGLREALDSYPFGDPMRSAIQAGIDFYKDATPPAPELPRNSVTNQPITFTPKISIGGKELLPSNNDPFRR